MPTNVVVVDIDAVWASSIDLLLEIIVLVVHCSIETELVDDVSSLDIRTHTPNHATAQILGGLTGNSADDSGCGRNEDSLTGFWLPHHNESEITRNPKLTENMQAIGDWP